MKLLRQVNKFSTPKRFSSATTSYLKGNHLELKHNTTLDDLLVNACNNAPDHTAGELIELYFVN